MATNALVVSGSSSPLVVVSIDFGTSRTGFAYAFTSDDGSVPDVYKKIYAQDGYHKQPTCLYVDVKNSELLAFGHEAREMALHDMSSEGDSSNRHLFAAYKKGLEGENPSGDTMWPALDKVFNDDDFEMISSAAELPVQTLITMTLKTVKEEIFDFVKSRDGISLVANQVRWVVTLPAIWSEPAKQIMKQSARNAGLISDESSSNSRLLLALEPEAALMGISRGLSTLLPKIMGKTVMVADNGGGTVDICAVVSAVGLSVPKVQWNFFFFYSLICFRL
jgi:molecular chaperone DnaK (HSP70)